MASKPKAPGLLAHLDSIFAKLAKRAGRALRDGRTDDIHEVRVATRQMKAAIELFDSRLRGRPRKRFLRALRSLRRSLGAVRDFDVTIEHLGEFKNRRHAEASAWLRHHFKRQRAALAKGMQKEGNFAEVRANLDSWRVLRARMKKDKTIDRILDDALARHLCEFVAIGQVLVNEGRQVTSELLPGCNPRIEKADPHELRIAGKTLRYTIEMAGAAGRPIPVELIKSFKRIQRDLGMWHDWTIVAERIMGAAAETNISFKNGDLARQLLALAQDALRRAQRWHRRYETYWRERGRTIVASIEPSAQLERPDDTVAAGTARQNGGVTSRSIFPTDRFA